MRTSILQEEVGNLSYKDFDVQACMREAKERMKAMLDRAIIVARNPKAKESLKSIQVAYLAILADVPQTRFDDPAERRVRKSTLYTKLNEAWARYEVEE